MQHFTTSGFFGEIRSHYSLHVDTSVVQSRVCVPEILLSESSLSSHSRMTTVLSSYHLTWAHTCLQFSGAMFCTAAWRGLYTSASLDTMFFAATSFFICVQISSMGFSLQWYGQRKYNTACTFCHFINLECTCAFPGTRCTAGLPLTCYPPVLYLWRIASRGSHIFMMPVLRWLLCVCCGMVHCPGWPLYPPAHWTAAWKATFQVIDHPFLHSSCPACCHRTHQESCQPKCQCCQHM